ncbi:MAG: 8-amino-7-oxononanoate synthase [Bacteroidota bacterium]
MDPVEQYLESKLQERQQAGNLRRLTLQHAPVDLYSNDYLGLATNGILLRGIEETNNNKQVTGSTGSRLLSGNAEATEQLETRIAEFHKAESALLFNSGYDANIGLISSISNRHATILYDELCHASIIDGIRLRQVNHLRFSHNNLQDLEEKLQKATTGAPIIVIVESIYSMDGDMAPLTEIVALTTQYHASLIVDEAHATGIFGSNGEGLVCSLGLQENVFARVHTFGKALGCHGAVVVGSNILKQYLINFARSFIYTTALPLHTVHTVSNAYKYLASPNFANKPLHDLITYFREKIKRSDNKGWMESSSSIQALVIGNNVKTKNTALSLQNAGLQINPILHPTVPLGMERLRVCLHSFNTTEQVDLLFEILNINP